MSMTLTYVRAEDVALRGACYCPGAAGQSAPNWVASNSGEVLSHAVTGQKSEITTKRNLSLSPSVSGGGRQPWGPLCLQLFPSISASIFMCHSPCRFLPWCPNFPFLRRITSHVG